MARRQWWLGIGAALLLVACEAGTGAEGGASDVIGGGDDVVETDVAMEEGEEEYVDPDENALTVDDDDQVDDVTVEQAAVVLRFKPGATRREFRPGQTLMGARKRLFLRKIVSVEENGDEVRIHTAPATLAEAAKRAHFTRNLPLPLFADGELPTEHIFVGGMGCPPPPGAPMPDGGCPGRKPRGIVMPVGCPPQEGVPEPPGGCPPRLAPSGAPETAPPAGFDSAQGAARLFDQTWPFDTTVFEDDSPEVSLEVAGQLGMTLSLTVDADFDILQLERLEAYVSGSTSVYVETAAHLAAEYHNTKEKRLAHASSPAVAFAIGIVPVWISLTFDLYAGFELDADVEMDASWNLNMNAGITAGARWTDHGGWSAIWDPYHSEKIGSLVIDASGGLTAKAFVRCAFGLKLYDVIGPEISITPYAKLTTEAHYGTTSDPELCYDVSVGIGGEAAFDVSAFGFELARWEDEFDIAEVSIAADCLELERETVAVVLPTDRGVGCPAHSIEDGTVALGGLCCENEDCQEATSVLERMVCSGSKCRKAVAVHHEFEM